jgi:ribonuclease HI
MKYWDFRESGKPRYDYIAYTDGSYLVPKNFGAAACIVLDGECSGILYSWSEVSRYSTSNRQELAGIVHALLHTPPGSSVLVRSDSENGIAQLTGAVRSKKDADLVQLFHKVRKERHLRITLEWVRSHSGDPWNDYVDNLCIEALDLFETDGTRVREGVDPQALYAYLCRESNTF